MGYGMHFPTHQVGGQPELWDIRGYGFSGLWVMTGPTVVDEKEMINQRSVVRIHNQAETPAAKMPLSNTDTDQRQLTLPSQLLRPALTRLHFPASSLKKRL